MGGILGQGVLPRQLPEAAILSSTSELPASGHEGERYLVDDGTLSVYAWKDGAWVEVAAQEDIRVISSTDGLPGSADDGDRYIVDDGTASLYEYSGTQSAWVDLAAEEDVRVVSSASDLPSGGSDELYLVDDGTVSVYGWDGSTWVDIAAEQDLRPVETESDLPSGGASERYVVDATDAVYEWTGSAWEMIGEGRVAGLDPTQRERVRCAYREETIETGVYTSPTDRVDGDPVTRWQDVTRHDVDLRGIVGSAPPTYVDADSAINVPGSEGSYLQTPSGFPSGADFWSFIGDTGAFAVGLRLQFTDTITSATLLEHGAGSHGIEIGHDGTDLYAELYSGGSMVASATDTWSPSTGEFYDIVCLGDGSRLILTIDGSGQDQGTISGLTTSTGGDHLWVARDAAGETALDARLQALMIEPQAVSVSEMRPWLQGDDYHV